MTIEMIFVTHSTSEDNETGVASGWADPPLSSTGEEQARRLRERWGDAPIDAVYASDLQRSHRAAKVGFGTRFPVYIDYRLREIDFGEWTQHSRAEVEASRAEHVLEPYPGGESYLDAVERHRPALAEIARKHDGGTVLVVGHYATWMAVEHLCGGRPLEEIARVERTWQPGWRYTCA